MKWIDDNTEVLILQTAQKMPDEEREAMEKRVEEKTGHVCVIIDKGVTLVAQVSPGELCEK